MARISFEQQATKETKGEFTFVSFTRDIREQLNLRLCNGQDGPKLLKWLNHLPETKETLDFYFDGVPVTKQNLSAWRRGGFRQWEIQFDWVQQACELRDFTGQMQEETLDHELLAGSLIALVSVRYAALLNTWGGEPNPEFEQKRRLPRGMAQDAALIQCASRLRSTPITGASSPLRRTPTAGPTPAA